MSPNEILRLKKLATSRLAALDTLQELVSDQACDDGLWFPAKYATEAYLQQKLRDLHAAIESALSEALSP